MRRVTRFVHIGKPYQTKCPALFLRSPAASVRRNHAVSSKVAATYPLYRRIFALERLDSPTRSGKPSIDPTINHLICPCLRPAKHKACEKTEPDSQGWSLAVITHQLTCLPILQVHGSIQHVRNRLCAIFALLGFFRRLALELVHARFLGSSIFPISSGNGFC